MGRARVGIAVLILLVLLGGLTVLALVGSRFAPDSAPSAARPPTSSSSASPGSATGGPNFTVPTSPAPNDLPTDLPAPTATPAATPDPTAAAAAATAPPTADAGSGPMASSAPIPTPVPDAEPASPPPAAAAKGYVLTGIEVTVGRCLWDEERDTTTCPVSASFSYVAGGAATSQSWSVVVDSDYCGPCGNRYVALPAQSAGSFAISGRSMHASFFLVLTKRQTPLSCRQSYLHVATPSLNSDSAEFLGAQRC